MHEVNDLIPLAFFFLMLVFASLSDYIKWRSDKRKFSDDNIRRVMKIDAKGGE